jgi:hypothetical protein
MRKYYSYILSLITLLAVFQPCMDGGNCENHATTAAMHETSCCQQSANDNDHCSSDQGDNDCCPAICVCACIPITVVGELPVYHHLPNLEIVTLDYPPVINHFFEFTPNIWQPPRLS